MWRSVTSPTNPNVSDEVLGFPLARLRVVELSKDVSAAFCGKQFAAWGAEVAMLEPKEGSPLRLRHPLADSATGGRHSLLWAYVAMNKRAVGGPVDENLDLLLPAADVFVTDYEDEELASLGRGIDVLRQTYPHLVIVQITPFGRSGPYRRFRGSDIVCQALSGYMILNGDLGRPPLRVPGQIAPFAIGAGAFVGGLAACHKQGRTGRGDLVEVCGMETLSTLTPFLKAHYEGIDRERQGGADSGVRYFPCQDGWVAFHPLLPEERPHLAAVLGIPDDVWPEGLLEGTLAERVECAIRFFTPYTRAQTVDHIFLGLEHAGIVCGKLLSPRDLLAQPQLEARDFYATLAHPDLGDLRTSRQPVKLLRGRAVEPALGVHGPIVATALGWRPRPAPDGPASGPPLEGVRIVDLTQAWIGPFATLLLASLGADVIKVESHKRPDVWRQANTSPVPITDIRGERVNRSPNFNSVNYNKRDIALDLTTPAARDLCRRLIARADVVADNFTPKVMGKFGLDYDSLCSISPDIVAVSCSGFGKTGPWADFKSNGSAIQGLGGWDWRHRYPGGEAQLLGFYQPDAIGGFHFASYILLGLLQRERTGRGEAFDASMLEIAATHVGEQILEAQLTSDEPGCANRDPDASPNGVFPTAGDDRWIAISVSDDGSWGALLTMPEVPAELSSDRYTTLTGRRGDEDRLEALLGAWTMGWDGEALMKALQARGVSAGVVRRIAEAVGDPHLVARKWFKPAERPDLGLHSYNGFPWRFESFEPDIHIPPPRLGEHSASVLREELGLIDTEIADLMSQGVTGTVF